MHDALRTFSPEEFDRASWLRSVEWGKWPLFLSQPVFPVMLVGLRPWTAGIVVVALSWYWCLLRYRYISYDLMRSGVFWVRLKWLSIPVMAFYFGYHREWLSMFASLLTPVLIPFFGILVPPADIGTIQKRIWQEVGFAPEAVD